MENLNIALIGCGMIGREHIERIQNRIRGAQVWPYATYLKKAQRRALRSPAPAPKVYTDFNEVINDPDVKRCCSLPPRVSSTRVRFWQRQGRQAGILEKPAG